MEMITIPAITATITPRMPIWTGNREMEMAKIKESGILGGMRWWYEAILRGFGVKVCNPCPPKERSASKCQYDGQRARKSGIASDGFYGEKEAVKVCPACQLFGCTGWSKQFTMQWYQDDGVAFAAKKDTYKHPNHKKQGTYTVVKVKGRTGQNCRAVFYPGNDQVGKILHYLLQFLSFWGGFGARPQMGCGMSKVEIAGDYSPMIYRPKIARPGTSLDLPDLRDFFFCQIQLKDGKNRPPDYHNIEVKYRIRQALAGVTPRQRDLRHYICGEVRGNTKISAKIFISRPFDNQILIRGYLPRQASVDYNRENILDEILDTLQDYSAIAVKDTWVEFKPEEDDYLDWVLSLVDDLVPLDLAKSNRS